MEKKLSCYAAVSTREDTESMQKFLEKMFGLRYIWDIMRKASQFPHHWF